MKKVFYFVLAFCLFSTIEVFADNSKTSAIEEKGQKYKCKRCKGSGFEPLVFTCDNCGGEGKKSRIINCPRCSGEKNVRDEYGTEKPCPSCNGSGKKLEYPTCSKCSGSGTIKKPCRACNGAGVI